MDYEKMTKDELIRKLKLHEEQFKNTFEQVAVGIAHVDLNGQFIKINRHFCDITGYSEQEILKSTFHNITYPDDINMQNQIRKKVLDGEDSSYTIEKRYIKKDNSLIWVNLTVTLIREPGGEPHYFISIIENITERKKAEEHIRKLSHAIEQSSSAIVITDIKGNIEYVNPSFSQLTGYTREKVIGQNPRFLKSSKTPSEVYKDLWETLTSGNEWRGEFCNKKENGELYYEFASISSVKNDEGTITNFVAVKEDITERKESGRRLNAQHEVTKVLSESSTIKEASPMILQAICEALEWELGEIWEFDQEKKALYNTEIWHVPSLKIPEFKAATKQITFPPKIGLPGRVWKSAEPLWIADVVHDTSFLRASVADKEGLHGAFGFPIIIGSKVLGTICFFSREIRKPDNDLLSMMTAIGRQIGLFIKRKQAEDMLLQTEKLNALGTITAGVSHDFNNILAIISGNVQLLQSIYKDHEELTKTLRTIKRATNDGAQISRRMLKFTQTAKDTVGFVPFDINELINQAIDFTKPRWKNEAQAKGVNYCMDTEEMKKVPSILCNPTEIREVFVNIINNALDAMPDGGIITVTTRCVRSEELGVESRKENDSELRTKNSELNGDFIEIIFADNGEGMFEEVKKNIFDPFFTTKGVEGTGLGMSTSYGIIARHGGKIEVESEVGKGTIFNLQFPTAAKADSPKESPETKQEIKTNSLLILVVDDEEEICNILVKFLSGGGHMVRVVDNGREAMILSNLIDYDLVLCDIAMPEVYGYDVIRTLNKLEKRPKIGIITGWGGKLKPLEEKGLKVDFILKKPFDFTELTKHINDVISTGCE